MASHGLPWLDNLLHDSNILNLCKLIMQELLFSVIFALAFGGMVFYIGRYCRRHLNLETWPLYQVSILVASLLFLFFTLSAAFSTICVQGITRVKSAWKERCHIPTSQFQLATSAEPTHHVDKILVRIAADRLRKSKRRTLHISGPRGGSKSNYAIEIMKEVIASNGSYLFIDFGLFDGDPLPHLFGRNFTCFSKFLDGMSAQSGPSVVIYERLSMCPYMTKLLNKISSSSLDRHIFHPYHIIVERKTCIWQNVRPRITPVKLPVPRPVSRGECSLNAYLKQLDAVLLSSTSSMAMSASTLSLDQRNNGLAEEDYPLSIDKPALIEPSPVPQLHLEL